MYQVSILFIQVWRRCTESSLLIFSRFQSFLVSVTGISIYFLQVRTVQVRLVQCQCILSPVGCIMQSVDADHVLCCMQLCG